MFGGAWALLQGHSFALLASLVGVDLLLRPGRERRFAPSADTVSEVLRRWRDR
jgi:hypothetical protein